MQAFKLLACSRRRSLISDSSSSVASALHDAGAQGSEEAKKREQCEQPNSQPRLRVEV